MAASVFLHLLQVFITQQFPAPPCPTVDTTMGYEAVKFYRPMFHYLHLTLVLGSYLVFRGSLPYSIQPQLLPLVIQRYFHE